MRDIGYLSRYWPFMGTCVSFRESLHNWLRSALRLLGPPFLSKGGRGIEVLAFILSMIPI
jgi:hypothetical protein